MNKYEKAFEHLIINEGGFSNDPLDKGGKTIYGITSKNYPLEFEEIYEAFQKGDITGAKHKAEFFYRLHYWDDKYDKIKDSSLAFKLFDLSVNMSKKRAVKFLQTAINKILVIKRLEVDGIFGKQTLYYINRLVPDVLYSEFIFQAELYYKKLWNFFRFGKGWINRLNKRIYLE